MNGALRRALADAQVTEDDLAERLDVDPKTVRRWITGRTPYPRHRFLIAATLDVEEADLWPQVARPAAVSETPVSEILATYPHRWTVPRPAWQALFGSARLEIGILVYAGLFLAEDTGILGTFTQKASQGVRVRIMLGDPESERVSARGTDEGVGDSIAAKIRNSLVLYRPLLDVEGIEIRLHDTVLYSSIYRADDQLMVNAHAYGIPASDAPVLHLRKVGNGDLASTYLGSFERVWSEAEPLR